MINISGFDKLARELKEAQKAFAEIDGELGSVSFDPHDPMSIEGAIKKMEEMLDEKLGSYTKNSIVSQMYQDMKENYRVSIVGKAAQARLENGED